MKTRHTFSGVLAKMLSYLVKITLSNDCFHIFYR